MVLVAAIGAVLAAGWYFSSLLLRPPRTLDYPDLAVAVREGEVWLRRSWWTEQPGEWGLRWPSGPAGLGAAGAEEPAGTDRIAGVGPVLGMGAPGVVRRPLLPGAPAPAVGPVALDAGRFGPDPASVGLAFDTVAVAGPLGEYPAWLVPAAGSRLTWVVAVHGRGAERRECLRVLPALHRLGHPVLAISYRNDPDAPPSPDGHYHLGDTEWRDVAAAAAHARAAGATGLVLYGWSMGAAALGAYLDRAELVLPVRAVVWDSPVVNWRATLRLQAAHRHLPPGLTAVATWLSSRRVGIDFDRFDLAARPPAHRPPTLLVQGAVDTAVPVAAARALAAAAAGLNWPLRYLEVPGAEHTASWNTDPVRYETAVADFLTAHAPRTRGT